MAARKNSPLTGLHPLAAQLSALAVLQLAATGRAGDKPVPPPEPSMAPAVRSYVREMLTEAQFAAAMRVLAHADAWGSLGPDAPDGPPPPDLPVPSETVQLAIPDDARGDGTAENPYRDVIGGFLQQFTFEPHAIEGYLSAPDPARVDAYLASLAYSPKTVTLPPGYYAESMTLQDSPLTRVSRRRIAVDVPPGIWLRGEGRVVVQPAVEPGEGGALIHLNIRSGLINVTLDGSGVPGFEPRPATRVTAVTASHRAVVAHCHIHDFTGNGIDAAGSRGRAGAWVLVYRNIIENIGYSGISSQSHWIIRDNRIRYAGVLRPDGGGGDDGIIPRWGVGGEIVNNLVILALRPHGRHVISSQASQGTLVAGNLSVAEGSLRNNIGFSDGAHDNRFVGNLAIGAGRSTRDIQAGISVNGAGNLLEYNVSIGNPQGFRTLGREGREPNVIRYNYAEYQRQGIHRSSHYEAHDNELKRNRTRVPVVDPAPFGFFRFTPFDTERAP